MAYLAVGGDDAVSEVSLFCLHLVQCRSPQNSGMVQIHNRRDDGETRRALPFYAYMRVFLNMTALTIRLNTSR